MHTLVPSSFVPKTAKLPWKNPRKPMIGGWHTNSEVAPTQPPQNPIQQGTGVDNPDVLQIERQTQMTVQDVSKLTGNSRRGKTVVKGSRSLVTSGWMWERCVDYKRA